MLCRTVEQQTRRSITAATARSDFAPLTTTLTRLQSDKLPSVPGVISTRQNIHDRRCFKQRRSITQATIQFINRTINTA
jgi:hypothetical protein